MRMDQFGRVAGGTSRSDTPYIGLGFMTSDQPPMNPLQKRVGRLAAIIALALVACRIEKVRPPDTTAVGSEPEPGIPSCGITTGSRVVEDGIGMLRIGASIDAVRANCAWIGERPGATAASTSATVDLGRDTAAVDFVGGILRRITLHHQAYRTGDSLGVGTHISRLMALRSATGLTERNKLYAVSPAYCGLRWLVADPAPKPPSAQSGRAALRRLPGETRALALEIIGCVRRR
jgi:hypothetical protein